MSHLEQRTSWASPQRTTPGSRVADTTRPFRNQVLAALTDQDVARLRPRLIACTLHPGQILHRQGALVGDVYFLEDGLARVSILLRSGEFVGTTLLGKRSVLGLGPAVAGAPARNTATVVVGGPAFRIGADALAGAIRSSASLADVLMQNVCRLNEELQADLGCISRHSVEQRLARLLLQVCASLEADRIAITQEELASVLSVQRTTVSSIARALKKRGVLAYARGAIRLVNAGQLEAISCGCGVAAAVDMDQRRERPSLAYASSAGA